MFLVIDTIGQQSLVALGEEGKLVSKIIWQSDYKQSEELLGKIDELLEVERGNLTGVVVVNGPGSYTGIRVGVSTGNALGFALGVPVVGVSYLEVLAGHAMEIAADRPGGDNFALRPSEDCEVVVLVRSIAEKYYYGVFKKRGSEVRLLGEYGNTEFAEILAKRRSVNCVVGEFGEDLKEKADKNVIFLSADYSRNGVVEELVKLSNGKLADAAKNSLCEPLYINQPHITPAKQK